MPEFFEARRLRYEIHVLAEGRWRIDSVINDGRDGVARRFDKRDFEETERRVVEHANAALAAGPFQAVKVVRERIRADGFSTVSEIFLKQAPEETAEAPLTVAPYEGPIAPCETVDEVYAREGYKVIGTLLRSFLDKLAITPPELLHYGPYIRKLNDNYGLVQGAVHQVATAQVKAAGGDQKARLAALLGFADAIERRAREAAGERRLPVLEEGDLERLHARVEARMGPKDAIFYTNVAIARALQGGASIFGKLETALGWLERPLPAPLRALVEDYVACAIDNPSVVRDLLGHRENLAAALFGLADLARGVIAVPSVGDARLGILATELAKGALPSVTLSLWERVLREVQRGRPLAKNDERREWTILMKVSDRLTAECPAALKDAMKQAFRARIRRLHDADVA
jgi:hypothetical protein